MTYKIDAVCALNLLKKQLFFTLIKIHNELYDIKDNDNINKFYIYIYIYNEIENRFDQEFNLTNKPYNEITGQEKEKFISALVVAHHFNKIEFILKNEFNYGLSSFSVLSKELKEKLYLEKKKNHLAQNIFGTDGNSFIHETFEEILNKMEFILSTKNKEENTLSNYTNSSSALFNQNSTSTNSISNKKNVTFS